ncbi:helix-turn-helix domain-containing protein [Neisseriaceae bacterium ESL0693]|nr:helix-turn-helix domain-containing protein [Neisseriaceae bacterium ESL0693]
MVNLITYTVIDAAKICHCHEETIRRHIRSGELAARKVGKGYCITASALDAFLNDLQNEQVQVSLERKGVSKCLFIKEKTDFGILTSSRQIKRELDALLAPETKGRRKSCTIKSSMICGDKVV